MRQLGSGIPHKLEGASPHRRTRLPEAHSRAKQSVCPKDHTLHFSINFLIAQSATPQQQALTFGARRYADRLAQLSELFLLKHDALRRRFVQHCVNLDIEWFAETPMIATLPISGLIMRD